MKIFISCQECFEQNLDGSQPYAYLKVTSINESSIFEFECPMGHQSKTVLRTPKHELLFTIGANAFIDGYFREVINQS